MLAERGYAVAVCGRDAVRAEQVAADLNGRALGVAADVTDPAQAEAVVATVTGRLGPIDVLVNAAGVRDQRALPWESDPADWWRTLEVNVRGVMLMTSAVLPGMIARGRGHIVDLGSGIAFRAEPRYSAYSVSKAAAYRWLDNVATALGADSPVRVVNVSPGVVRTDMTEEMWDESDDIEFGSTEPVENFVRRFVAGELDHLHGQFIHAVKDDY